MSFRLYRGQPTSDLQLRHHPGGQPGDIPAITKDDDLHIALASHRSKQHNGQRTLRRTRPISSGLVVQERTVDEMEWRVRFYDMGT